MEKHKSRFTFALLIDLAIVAGLHLIPGALGYGWNNMPGPSLLNAQDSAKRYPAIDITAEPWGTSVVPTPSESRLRRYLGVVTLPLWNPYQGIGEPYAAQDDGSFWYGVAGGFEAFSMFILVLIICRSNKGPRLEIKIA